MRPFSLRTALLCVASIALSASESQAQCAEWSDRFTTNGVTDLAQTLGVCDTGSGLELLVGGRFLSAGGVDAVRIASWDGSAWSKLGSGLVGPIPCCGDLEALCNIEFDDGGGSALYVGGRFVTAGGVTATHIAKWDGVAWSPVGAGFDGAVEALAVFDDGSGPALYAGGAFRESAGTPMHSLSRWNGTDWLPLGAGLSSDGHTRVRALAVFDDGSGPALYIGGNLSNYNGTVLGHIARWDGANITAVGGYFDFPVNTLLVHDDGTGNALFAGGKFLNHEDVSMKHVAKWDGTAWSPLDDGVNGSVHSFAQFDDGSGPALFVAGGFDLASGLASPRIAKWDGAAWSAVGGGLTGGAAYALAVFDSGAGDELYVAGQFHGAGSLGVDNIARWNGAQWSLLGGDFGANASVYALETADLGAGEALYAGGSFSVIGSTQAKAIARWNGATWSALGGAGFDSATVYELCTFDDGAGTALYVGGTFITAGGAPANNIAKWDGASWSALGGGVNSTVSALAVYDDGSGPALFAGGWFNQAEGASANYVAKWDGASWSPLGAGVLYGVRDLLTFDDGSGPALFAAGNFTTAGGAAAKGFARWDGATWTPLGVSTIGGASALAIYDDGSGPSLFVYAGVGSGAGAHASLAKWNGSALTLVGGPLTPLGGSPLSKLFVFDDGTGGGDELAVAGHFNFANGLEVNGIAKWNGASWSALGSGLTSVVAGAYDSPHAMAAFDDGSGGARDLFVGGHFTHADGMVSSHIAAWRGCTPPLGTRYCFGDGSGTACPCGNASAIGADQGCLHSAGFGAQLGAAGSSSIASDDQVFTVATMPANKSCVLFVGNLPMNGGAGVVFGDGLRCAGPSVHRLGVRSSDANGVASWGPGFSPLNHWSAGDTRYFQVWFRDPTGPCGNATNMSSALRIVFTN